MMHSPVTNSPFKSPSEHSSIDNLSIYLNNLSSGKYKHASATRSSTVMPFSFYKINTVKVTQNHK